MLQIFVDTSVYVNLKLCCIDFSLHLLNFLLVFFIDLFYLNLFFITSQCFVCYACFSFLSVSSISFPYFSLHFLCSSLFYVLSIPLPLLPFLFLSFHFHFLFQVFVKHWTGPERPGTLPKNSRTPLLELLRNTPEHLLTGCLPSPYPPNHPPPPFITKTWQKITKPKKLVNHQWINKCISSVTGKQRLGQIDKITLLNDFWRF